MHPKRKDDFRRELRDLTDRIYRMIADVRHSGPNRAEVDRRDHLRTMLGEDWDPACRCWRTYAGGADQ